MLLLEGLLPKTRFMTEVVDRVEAVIDLSKRESEAFSFLGLPLIPQLSLRVLSWPASILKLDAELLRRFESK